MTRLMLHLELTSWGRDRRLLAILCAVVLVLAGATVWATAADIAQNEAQLEAAHAAREQWEGQGAANPHNMAHFGDFAFRPTGPLARLDRGVQAQLGKVLFIEGHRQGIPLHADAQRAGSLTRFARLDAAFLLQTVVPLLLIFLGATGLAADRESGRLKLALIQGGSVRGVLGGHFLALWGLGLVLLAVVVTATLATSAVLGQATFPAPDRLAGFVLAHALFLAVTAAGVVAAMVWLSSARAALLVLLAAWVVGTALLPRASAGLAGTLYPLPSQDAFQAAMRAAREAGPDGHNPEDQELARLREATLAEHGVETVEELPINFDGIAMQVDEEFGNRVWDEHYGALRDRLGRQRSVGSLVALLNPFQAIDHVSMALAGSDLAHDLDFQQQAETYRRTLIEQLNHEHAYGGSQTGDWSWQASPEFYAGLASFSYTSPGLDEAMWLRRLEIVALLLWGAMLLLALRRATAHLDRGALAC